MIRGASTRQLFESKGPAGFTRLVYQSLGLIDQHGRRRYDRARNPLLHEVKDTTGAAVERLRPEEFSLRDLAESVLGEGWVEQLNPDAMRRAELVERRQPILEAGTGAVMASAFANINAFTAVVSGLLEIKVMEGWQLPEFIAEED